MNNRHLSLASLLVALPFAACECEVSELGAYELPGVLAGVVCDTESGLPLEESPLGFESNRAAGVMNAYTDEGGAFRLEGLPAGPGRLVVTAGEQGRAFEVSVLEGETTMFEDPSCRAPPALAGTGAVEGLICNRHVGERVQDGQVTLPLADGTALSTQTDADGFFQLVGVPAGEHVLHVLATGYQRSFLVEVTAQETFVLDVGGDCSPPNGNNGLVGGALCDPAEAGAPLAGAEVYVTDAAGEWFSDVSDTDGAFLAGPMALGVADVRVVRAPDVDVRSSVLVTAGGEAQASFPSLCEGTGDPEDPRELDDPGYGDPGDPQEPPGDVRGRVCSPNGAAWLAGATVWLDAYGERYETFTDGEGRWQLDGVPAGTWLVHIEKGSFSTTAQVTVSSGSMTEVPEEECHIGQDDVKIAVVDGNYDDVYSVLLNVGVEADIIDRYQQGWAATLLGNYDLLATYDIVLINCGAEENGFFQDPVFRQNLAQYVQSGGSLYASDWAYDFVERTFPGYVDFIGDDSDRDDAQRGRPMDSVIATVADTTLAASLGQNQLEIHYALAQWAVMGAVAPGVRVYLRADAQIASGFGTQTLDDVPHTVGFPYGEGKVIYTSFHQEPGLNLAAERLLQLLVFEL